MANPTNPEPSKWKVERWCEHHDFPEELGYGLKAAGFITLEDLCAQVLTEEKLAGVKFLGFTGLQGQFFDRLKRKVDDDKQ